MHFGKNFPQIICQSYDRMSFWSTCCDKNEHYLHKNTVNYINSNYENILIKIKKNKLPTLEKFINQLSDILFKS